MAVRIIHNPVALPRQLSSDSITTQRYDTPDILWPRLIFYEVAPGVQVFHMTAACQIPRPMAAAYGLLLCALPLIIKCKAPTRPVVNRIYVFHPYLTAPPVFPSCPAAVKLVLCRPNLRVQLLTYLRASSLAHSLLGGLFTAGSRNTVTRQSQPPDLALDIC